MKAVSERAGQKSQFAWPSLALIARWLRTIGKAVNVLALWVLSYALLYHLFINILPTFKNAESEDGTGLYAFTAAFIFSSMLTGAILRIYEKGQEQIDHHSVKRSPLPLGTHLRAVQNINDYYVLMETMEQKLSEFVIGEKALNDKLRRRVQAASVLSSKIHICRLQILDLPIPSEPDDGLERIVDEEGIRQRMEKNGFSWKENHQNIRHLQAMIAMIVDLNKQGRLLTMQDIEALEAVCQGSR
jgi:hypothetical protein